MKILKSHITIGTLVFEFVHQIEIESSWNLLTDTAKIILPANLKLNNNKLLNVVKAGDSVTVKIGYEPNLNTVFTGYVTYVSPKVPIEIYCEDEMWKHKQNNIVDAGKKQYLTEILNKHFNGVKIKAIDVEIGKYYIDNISGAQFLESIKSDFGLYSFFRGDTLVVGHRYDRETANKHKFKLDYNVVQDDLQFKTKDQIKLKVRAISNNADGTKVEVEVGEPTGELRTLNFYNLSEKELKAAADREFERLLYDGWRGSFTAFGEPFVQHGDIVTLLHAEDSDKTGDYWVDDVNSTFGVNGYRQEIKLGARA